ncbi:hypothetical protein [Methylobacterium sp. R2-1]|uniref:hypothetical protein n=1 Tax=Methylobacterium sp. R2-1 TaxID=2587064 RepID=UPI0016201003|nr:hypothetical protein [Methylobacterium sp. R2-1]MBB2960318.1 hypothetical protein [Methylobacterium sp. R2-1]
MRFLLAPALLAVACGSSLAAAPSPFRAALAVAGGCGAHRSLAEERLGRLGAATATAVPQGEADLFGKPTGQWTEDEIRDALSAFAACETRSGPAGTKRSEHLARDLRGLEAALRRAIVVGHARPPVEAGVERAPHGAGPDGASAGLARLRQGPAFIPALRSGGAAPEGQRPVAAPVGAPHAEPPRALAAMPVTSPDAWDDAPPARTRHAQPPAADPAPAGPPHPALVPVAAHRPSTERTQCPISLGTFELLQAEMRLSEVEGLLGCRGTIDATATISGLGTFETYLWSDRGSGATVTLVFQNKRLRSKAQRGLGAEVGRGG